MEAPVNALVLLDEVGAGNPDPTEGAALAQAIIEQAPRLGLHYHRDHALQRPRLRLLTPGIENASVEFDVRTLQPTFHLRIGAPGASNALQIAQRLPAAGDYRAGGELPRPRPGGLR